MKKSLCILKKNQRKNVVCYSISVLRTKRRKPLLLNICGNCAVTKMK